MTRLICLFQFLFLILQYQIASSSSSSSSSAHRLCSPEQSSALLQFKHRFTIKSSVSWYCDHYGSRPSYPKIVSWNETTVDCCSWDGVTCDRLTGQVNELDLSCSQLYGTIPPNSSIFSLRHLRRLNLAYNDFSGSPIPPGFGQLASLTHLNLSSCFSGPIPSDFSHLSKLVSLELFYSIDQPLRFEPHNFDVLLQNLTKLQHLCLAVVNISSVVPSSLMNLTSLTYLDLGLTGLRGKLPHTIFHLPNLKELYLRNNPDLTGYLPKVNWSSSGSLSILVLSETSLSGELPNSIGYLKSLKYLVLGHCKFSGSVPDSLGKLSEMTYLDLSGNHLEGRIPNIFANLTQIVYLDLSGNNFNGQCLGNFSKVLKVLDLGMNNFHGNIPTTFAEGNKLRNIDLSGNQLEGPVPQSLGNCKNLEVLDIGNNDINDTFPYWLETLPELRVLVLKSNKFHGPMGTFKTKRPFPKLRIIDLSRNEFSGLLPEKYFEHFKAMRNQDEEVQRTYMGDVYYQDYVTVAMKGVQIEVTRILTIFTVIDLSDNKFRGEIPNIIGKLDSLRLLNLSHNDLIGNIPSSLANLSRLESLDLSSNQFSGTIPRPLTSLTFLRALNLSQNNLKGRIPQDNQFGTFHKSSYAGNSGLCGFPLMTKCRDSETSHLQPNDSTSASGFNWKVVLMGYGCGMVFGLAMGYLMFLTGKPKWFARIVEVERLRGVKRWHKIGNRRGGRRK